MQPRMATAPGFDEMEDLDLGGFMKNEGAERTPLPGTDDSELDETEQSADEEYRADRERDVRQKLLTRKMPNTRARARMEGLTDPMAAQLVDQAKVIEEQREMMHRMQADMRKLKDQVRRKSAPAPVSQSKRPDAKPTEYDGTEDLENYLCQVDTMARVQKWTNEEKSMMLKSAMKGRACAAVCDARDDSYPSLVAALRAEISETREMYNSQLKQRRQQKDETLTALARDIKHLAALAYGKDKLTDNDFTIRDCFIDAIKERGIRQKVRDGGPKTFADAVDLGKRLVFNQTIEDDRVRQVEEVPTTPTPPVLDFSRQMADLDERIKKLGDLEVKQKQGRDKKKGGPRSPRSPRGKPRKPLVCYYCRLEGHIQRYCPFKSGAEMRQPQGVFQPMPQGMTPVLNLPNPQPSQMSAAGRQGNSPGQAPFPAPPDLSRRY